MDRWRLSQLAGKILRARDVQGRGPVAFARGVLADPRLGNIRRYIPVSDDVAATPRAVAEVWQGGWVVPCPFCAGLEYGDPEEPLFLCCSCWNAEVGGKLLAVRYPAQVLAIEVLLLARPNGKTRGWLRHETVMDLVNENKLEGVG